MLRSVNKLLDIELAIMVRHYQLDSEEKLIRRERRMQADRITAMQTMTAGLAHEVRNPLNAAKLQLELLERRLRRQHDDPKLIEPSELAQQEIERLTALLNDFLAFARPPELHVQRPRRRRDRPHTSSSSSSSMPSAAARASSSWSPPTCSPPRSTRTSSSRSCSTSCATPSRRSAAGGHVTLELTGTHDTFTVRVQDDGPGIPLEDQARIYEPFFSTKEGGTGLGMSIVHSLVGLHGGRIELDTSARGTRFDVTIPRRQ